MRTFKRWSVAGAIALVALALVACPAMVPKVTDEIPDMNFTVAELEAGTAKTVTLDNHFEVDRDAQYTAKSANTAVATVAVANGVLTVTPKGSGATEVTVTASRGGNDPVSESFTVTVDRPDPPEVNQPPIPRTIPDVSVQENTTRTIDLARYYLDVEGDSLTYSALSSAPTIASVSVDGSVVTITARDVDVESTATITVSATDRPPVVLPMSQQQFDVTVTLEPVPNQAPTSDEIPAQEVTVFDAPTATIDLLDHFDDADGDDELMFEASSSDETVATEMIDGTTLTVTAVAAGTATITVKATDGKIDTPISRMFVVTVHPENNKAPTTVSGTSLDVIVQVVDDPTEVLNLSLYFNDKEDDTLAFEVSSSDDTIATATVDDATSMLTITAIAAGHATVTVTASDGMSSNDDVPNEAASIELKVRVLAATPEPDPENNPPTSTSIDDMSLTVGGDPRTVDLSMHFSDADADDTLTYSASSSVSAIATASVTESTLTITAGSAGTATITVTASDGEASAMERFDVTVTEAPNEKPQPTGAGLDDLKIELVFDSGGDGIADTSAAGTVDNMEIDLSDHFEDPDGALLFFKVTTSDDTVVDVHSVAADPTASPSVAASGSLDGNDDDATTLIIEPKKVGTATVTVTVTDVENAEHVDRFDVEVTGENTNDEPEVDSTNTLPPTDATGPFGPFFGLNSTGRFKSTDTMSKTVKVDLALLFNDDDNEGAGAHTSADWWEFEAMSSNEEAVMVTVERTNNNVAVPDEHNVVITPVGPGDAMITFKVTDSFGKTATSGAFPVKVNTPPVPYSGEGDDRKSLSTLMTYRGLVAGFSATASETLVDDPGTDATAEGYFSDADDDTLLCRLVDQTGDSATIAIASRNAFTLTGEAGKKGTSTFTIRCFDQVNGADFESAEDTLTVTVPFLQSIQ